MSSQARHGQSTSSIPRSFFLFLSLWLQVTAADPAAGAVDLQTLTGQVIDPEGKPVPHVQIVDLHTRSWTLSDAEGYFRLYVMQQNSDSLRLQRIGFEPTQVPVPSALGLQLFQILPQPLEAPGVYVSGSPLEHRGPASLRVLRSPEKTNADHGMLIRELPGLLLRTYGGPAGIATLSLDGGQASHTRILLDQFDLTNAQSGMTDLSQIPAAIVSAIQVRSGQADNRGSPALDGSVRLQTPPGTTGFSLGSGSYGYRNLTIQGALNGKHGKLNLFLGDRSDAGDYPVTWKGIRHSRRNNGLEQRFALVKGSVLVNPHLSLQALHLSSHQDRGVSGQVWAEDTLSHRRDDLSLSGLVLNVQHERLLAHLRISRRASDETFRDIPHARRYRHHSISHNLTANTKMDFRGNTSLFTSFEIQYEQVRSSSLTPEPRTSIVWNSSLDRQVGKYLRLVPRINLLGVPGEHNLLSAGIRAAVHPPLSLPLQVSLDLGTAVRQASFNDLYWEPGGNPDLEPEHARSVTLEAGVGEENRSELHLEIQQRLTTNLIQWTPQQAYWQPANIDSASRISFKLMGQLDHLPWKARLYGNVAFVNARRLVSGPLYARPLRYAPRWSGTVGFRWTPGQTTATLEAEYLGERIAMYGYPEDVRLPAVYLLSAAWSRWLQVGNWQFSLALQLENLMDLKYATILGYPEPGRNLRLTLTTAKL